MRSKVAYFRKTASQPTARRFASAPLSYRKTLTSVLAVATMIAMPVGNKARAQGFQGSLTNATLDPQSGLYNGTGFSVERSGTTDTVRLTAPTAVINWQPNETNGGTGAIDFLPSANRVDFQNDEIDYLGKEYTVLNRILPTGDAVGRSIGLNGTITAALLGADGEPIGGGRVWFYSPGGLLIGSGATFDVGGLLLTTGDPSVGGAGTAINLDAPINMNSGSGATNGVIIQAGATINARGNLEFTPDAQNPGEFLNSPTGSYFAVVSPRIQQSSNNVTVDGLAAYVAAENANLTINDGLFDITVPVGADSYDDDANGGTPNVSALQHSGSTLFDAQSTLDINRVIYLVSVPKNQALTQLLTTGPTRLGFAAADSVHQAADGTVVLSAARLRPGRW
jgi:filamentous hemagglutinin family protein